MKKWVLLLVCLATAAPAEDRTFPKKVAPTSIWNPSPTTAAADENRKRKTWNPFRRKARVGTGAIPEEGRTQRKSRAQ
ncbi:MAG: hypothetical protein AAF514_15145, partial [Verrucomicrobiota bacterium]